MGLGLVRRRHFLFLITVPALTGIAVFLIAWHFSWFSQFEMRVYDIGLNITESPAIESSCVIIAIDSTTLAGWQQPAFPISQHLTSHTRLVDVLSSAGAAVICFDVLFDRLDSATTENLAFFAETCRKAGSVVMASALEEQPDQQDRIFTVRRLLLPHPDLISSIAGVGLADVPLDADGKIRRAVTVISFQEYSLLSLPAQAVKISGMKAGVSLSTDSTFLIDYSWLSQTPVVSYSEVLKTPSLRDMVSGRIALIGVTVNEGNDNYPVPLGIGNAGGQNISGVRIHAAAIQTLLSDRRTLPASLLASFCLLMVLGSAVSLVARFRKTWISIIAFVLAAAVLLVGSVLAVPFLGLIVPISKLLFALAVWLATQWVLGITVLQKEVTSQKAVITDFKSDMESAQLIQQSLQPRTLPMHPSIDIAVHQITCKEVGGDYYDVVDFGNGRIGLLIGDVAGKGVSASLIMSNVQSVFRKEAQPHVSPSVVLTAINRHISSVSDASGRFMSLFYGILDGPTGQLVYSNAGHCRPAVRRSTGEVYELESGGFVLGPFLDMQWTDSDARLSEGDTLCLYTDGISEATDEMTDELFGEQRILEYLKTSSGSSENVLKNLLVQTQAFAHYRPFQDDWTAIIVSLHCQHHQDLEGR